MSFRQSGKWTGASDYPTGGQDRKNPIRWRGFASVGVGAALFATAYGAGWLGAAPPKVIRPGDAIHYSTGRFGTGHSGTGRFGNCYVGGGRNCIVDGDTFYMDRVKIRIADIDAPETHPSRCAEEDRLGRAATIRLRQLLNSGSVTLSSIDRDEDVYGRKLRNVAVDGADVGSALVNEGLAHWYVRGKLPWC